MYRGKKDFMLTLREFRHTNSSNSPSKGLFGPRLSPPLANPNCISQLILSVSFRQTQFSQPGSWRSSMASTAGFFATRARGITIVFVAMLALLTSAAFAQSPVSDDTYVSSATPTTNNGNSPSLVVQKSSNGTTLIKLDLTQLQAAGVQSNAVSKAYLKLYTSAVTGQGTLDLYQVTSSWVEGTVTYNTMPGMTLISGGSSCPGGIQCVNTS